MDPAKDIAEFLTSRRAELTPEPVGLPAYGPKDLVAHLRSEAGRNPCDRDLSNLIGELSTRSPEFRTWWSAHNVRYHQTGTKRRTTRSSATWSAHTRLWSSRPTPA